MINSIVKIYKTVCSRSCQKKDVFPHDINLRTSCVVGLVMVTFGITIIFIVTNILIPKAWKSAFIGVKQGQATHIRWLVFPLLTENKIELEHGYEVLMPLKPNMFHPKKDRIVSWREWVLEFGIERETCDDLYVAMDQPNNGQTNFVFVTGDRTIHDFDVDCILSIFPDSFDKILILEYPDNDIPWNSLRDCSIAEARELWHKSRKDGRWVRDDVVYITLKGRYGRVSTFPTEEDFMRMLLLSEDEIDVYNAHVAK